MHRLKPWVKINNSDFVLRQMLLPDIRAASGASFSFFSTSCQRHTSAAGSWDARFYPIRFWPRNLPDLNPVDYSLWSVLQGRGYRTKISDVNELKRRLISEWATVSHTVIECADVNLSSGVSVYALAFMLQADILSTRRNRDDVIMTRVTFLRDTETITARCLSLFSNVHLTIALTAQSDTSNFPRTDRQQDDANSRSYCVAVRSAKTWWPVKVNK